MIPAVTPQLTQLAIVYALLAFLLLCLCLATRWHWAVKAAMVLLVSGFYSFAHVALQGVYLLLHGTRMYCRGRGLADLNPASVARVGRAAMLRAMAKVSQARAREPRASTPAS